MKAVLILFLLVLAGFGTYAIFQRETENNIREIYRQSINLPQPSYLVYGNDSKLEVVSSQEKGYYKIFFEDHESKYLIPYDAAAIDLNESLSAGLQPRIKIKTEIFTEGKADSISIDSSLHYLDLAMKAMYTGYELEVVRMEKIDCSSLRSSGEINADNIRAHFVGLKKFDDLLNLHIYMVSKGDFLASVNALCVPSSGSNIILGDFNLLHNPVLLIHEILHAFELRHLELRPCKENVNFSGANVMDFKTKGCSHHLSIRQILLARFKEFVPQINHDVTFPKCVTCLSYSGDNTIFEDFSNSIEGSAIELPLNGDHGAIIKYKEEMETGLIPGSIRSVLINNYKSQAEALGIGATNAYANQMIVIHKKLRQRNLGRWSILNYQKMFGVNNLYGKIMQLDTGQMHQYLDTLETSFNLEENKPPIDTIRPSMPTKNGKYK